MTTVTVSVDADTAFKGLIHGWTLLQTMVYQDLRQHLGFSSEDAVAIVLGQKSLTAAGPEDVANPRVECLVGQVELLQGEEPKLLYPWYRAVCGLSEAEALAVVAAEHKRTEGGIELDRSWVPKPAQK